MLLILYQFLSIISTGSTNEERNKDILFLKYKLVGRTIQLDLSGYCYDKINVIYAHEKGKNTVNEICHSIDHQQNNYILTINESVTSDFEIILILERLQTIKIGSFGFDERDNVIVKGPSIRLSSRFGKDKEDFKKIKEQLLKGIEVNCEEGDNNTAIICHSTQDDLYLDLSGFADDFKRIKKIVLTIKQSVCDEIKELDVPNFTVIEEIDIYDPYAQKYKHSTKVLPLRNIGSLSCGSYFDIEIQTDNFKVLCKGLGKIENKLQGNRRRRISIDLSDYFTFKYNSLWIVQSEQDKLLENSEEKDSFLCN